MSYFGEDWDENEFPLAYLITIRTYGTWLHGDERSSVDRHDRSNKFGAPKLRPSSIMERKMAEAMKSPVFTFDRKQRKIVDIAIREVSDHRGYFLHALNVRSNHGHIVVHARSKPEPIANAFKSYATRKLKAENALENPEQRVWSRGRSRRYLWKEESVAAAVNYVLYCQGDIEFEEWYDSGRK